MMIVLFNNAKIKVSVVDFLPAFFYGVFFSFSYFMFGVFFQLLVLIKHSEPILLGFISVTHVMQKPYPAVHHS